MTILDDIIARKRQWLDKCPTVTDNQLSVSTIDFIAPFKHDYLGVIAELKSRSPSGGFIVDKYSPLSIAKSYVAGGADAISVLTDQAFFGGHIDHLRDVRRVVNLPVLCKDFFIDERQVRLARSAGADACLLMVSVLSDDQLRSLKSAIEALGMVALIEVQDKTELQRALALGATMIDINNRNLSDFSMHFTNSRDLCNEVPEGICVISASGIAMPADVKELPARIDGVLIGTALMKSHDRAAFIQEVKGAR